MAKKNKTVGNPKCLGLARGKAEMVKGSPQTKERRYNIYAPNTAALSPVRKAKIAETRLISSMNLDEMLEASNAIELGFRGEQIPVIVSPKARVYAKKVLCLNERAFSKQIAKQMQQNLVVKIIERNKSTTDKVKAEHLYHAIMKEV